MAAPRIYGPEHEDLVLAEIASGKTLTAVCAMKGMPGRCTVTRWLKENEDFADRYEEACQLGFDAMADETLAIADTEPEKATGPQGTRVDSGYVAWQKLRVDTRLKILERRCPDRYAPGAKVSVGNKEGETLKVEGGVDTAALTVQLAAALRAAKE